MTKVDMHIPGKSDLDVSFDGSRKIHQEAPFERYISRKVAGLEHSGWALSPDDTGFDPNDALVFDGEYGRPADGEARGALGGI